MPDETGARIFQGPFFELQIPGRWEYEIIENVPAFFDPMGAGALQIAATRDSRGLDEEMQRYLERNGLAFQEDRIARFQNSQGLECLACEFVKDNRFWMVQMIARETKLVIAMYNADETPAEEAATELAGLLASIRIFAAEHDASLARPGLPISDPGNQTGADDAAETRDAAGTNDASAEDYDG